MRKITKEMCDALDNMRPFKKSNTEIRVLAYENSTPCMVEVLLHGNKIAEYVKNPRTEKLTISNAGWFSNTTKERLNGLPHVNIHQSKGVWYLNNKEWDGKPISVTNGFLWKEKESFAF